MTEINIPQSQADALIAMEKHRADDNKWVFPDQGLISVPLVSKDKRENFLLDIRHARIDLAKVMYQNRARQVIILIRLDLGEKTHRNPDGQIVGAPHIHLYREGYADKWAFTLPAGLFQNIGDKWQSLQDFMNYCNISQPPFIERNLFL
jgi:hypothetical protein